MSASTNNKKRCVGRRLPHTVFPQPDGPHTVVTKPLRIDSPILRGQRSRTSSVITNLKNRKAAADAQIER